TTGTITVNPNITTGTTNVNGRFSTLILAPTSTLTANQIAIGNGPTNNNAVGQINTVKLGTGVNTFNLNQINIGNGSRDGGQIIHDVANTSGSLVGRNAAGTGRATLNLGSAGGATGVSGAQGDNSLVAGHNADLLLAVVTVGAQNRGTTLNTTLSFDQGT